MKKIFATFSLAMLAACGSPNGKSPAGSGSATASVQAAELKIELEAGLSQQLYSYLQTAVRGPFATGLCVPGESCDPPAFSLKQAKGINCNLTTYSVSKRSEYGCYLTLDASGVSGELLSSAAGVARDAVTAKLNAADAERVYGALNVQERGPFGTGLCIPGTVCDPVVLSAKSARGITCGKTYHSVSGQTEYSCEIRVGRTGLYDKL